MLLILGSLVHWMRTQSGTLPAFFGWSWLALGVGGAILTPAPALWLATLQAGLLLTVARQERSRTTIAEAGPAISTDNRDGLPS